MKYLMSAPDQAQTQSNPTDSSYADPPISLFTQDPPGQQQTPSLPNPNNRPLQSCAPKPLPVTINSPQQTIDVLPTANDITLKHNSSYQISAFNPKLKEQSTTPHCLEIANVQSTQLSHTLCDTARPNEDCTTLLAEDRLLPADLRTSSIQALTQKSLLQTEQHLRPKMRDRRGELQATKRSDRIR